MKVIKDLKNLYINRFPKNEHSERNRICRILCNDLFQKDIPPKSTVLDLGSGYCEFINNIKAKSKYAIDLNSEVKKFADKNVQVFICDSTKMPRFLTGKLDVVFASNFFEHLSSKNDVIKTLSEIKRVLKKQGSIIILHPNIRYIGSSYWDFLDHQLPLTEKSLIEGLELSGFKIVKVVKKLLPYTTKSRFPKWDWLIKIYLFLKPLQYLLGKQSLIIAKKQ